MRSIRRYIAQGAWRRHRWAWPLNWLACFLVFVITCSIITRSRRSNVKETFTEDKYKQYDNRPLPLEASNAVKISSSSEEPLDKVSSLYVSALDRSQSNLKLESSSMMTIKEIKTEEPVKEKDAKPLNENPVHDEPVFGFVNHSYHPTERPKSFIEKFASNPEQIYSNFKKSPTGEQIGSLLKAGASLRDMTKVPEKVIIYPPIENKSTSKKDVAKKSVQQNQMENNVIEHVQHESLKPHEININSDIKKEKKIQSKNRRKKPESLVESMLHNVGPALLSSAVLGSLGQNSGSDNTLLSFAGKMIPNVINGMVDTNKKNGNNNNVNALNSVVSGLKNVALSAVQQNSLSGGQNMISSLFGSMNSLGSDVTGGQGNPPNMLNSLQNFAGNVGPVLLSAALSNSNDNQGFVGKVVPALMKNMYPKNGHVKKQDNVKNNDNGNSKNTRLENRDLREREDNKDNLNRNVDKNKENHKQPKEQQDLQVNPMNQIASLAVAGLSNIIPSSVGVDKDPLSKGLVASAIEFALGSPNDPKNRKGQVFEWLRQNNPSTDQQDGIPPRLKMALQRPIRDKYKEDIIKFYDAITTEINVCNSVSTMGGVYKWKQDVMEKQQHICMDRDVNPENLDCSVLSFGIRNEWGFEEKAQEMGCKVWAFDPSMQTGNHNYSDNIEFFNIGIDATNRTLHIKNQVWSLFTYSAVLAHLGLKDTSISYLKIDLPSWEWSILEEILTNSPDLLSHVTQLGLTVHLQKAIVNPQLYQTYNDLLDKLFSYGGFQLFASTPNTQKSNVFTDPLAPERELSLEFKLSYLRV